jgi:hypothetical protein
VQANNTVRQRKRVQKVINIEGYTPDQILALSDAQLDAFVFCGEPVIFRAGTAQILGSFSRRADSLEIELAQIDGGGEGVLPTLWSLADRYAKSKKLGHVDWIVHALTCATPNLKLRRVLERLGFSVQKVRGDTEAYFLRHETA